LGAQRAFLKPIGICYTAVDVEKTSRKKMEQILKDFREKRYRMWAHVNESGEKLNYFNWTGGKYLDKET